MPQRSSRNTSSPEADFHYHSSLLYQVSNLFQLSKKMKPRLDWSETTKLNTLILKIVGVWPEGDGFYGLNFYTIYAYTSIIFFSYAHSVAQILHIFEVIDDLDAVAGSMIMSLSITLSILKSYCLITNMKTLKKLMKILDSDMFQPKSPKQRKMVEVSLKGWKTFHSTFLAMTFNTIILWVAFPILDKSYKEFRLPIYAWYPYRTNVSPNYEITYIHQIFATFFVGLLNINTDSFIAALHMYIGAQIDLLCDDLRNLDDSDFNRKFLDCIKHHKQILEFAKDANGVYNLIILAQFLVSVLTIAVSMFKLTVVIPLSSEFFSLMVYALAITMQIFIYCWYGNEVEIKSLKIPYAAFESDWTNVSLEGKKNMLFFVIKSQKPIKVSALNLFYLTLDNFLKILRTSYSYFAVLHQVNAPN